MVDKHARQGGQPSRRDFVRQSLLAGTTAAAWGVAQRSGHASPARPAASERIVLGVLGLGGRGSEDLKGFLANADVQVVAVCDAQKHRRDAGKATVDLFYGNADCRAYRDFREMFARPDVDAVLIATGDRWHALASILAAQSDKDIYCEKPCSMTIGESRALAESMHRYGRIYQAGTQRRTIPNFMYAVKLAHSGKLGRLRTVHANTLDPTTTQDWLPEQPLPPPEVVDWDMWLGPTPWRPFNKAYLEGAWHGQYDFHGGGILEWGSHTVDLCQWANQADAATPIEFHPTPDGGKSRYANGVELVMRSTGWLGLGTCSVRFEGDEGWIETGDSGRFVVSPDSLRSELRIEEMAGTDPKYHIRQFLDSVRTRVQPSANASVAAQSHIACHAAHLAWRLKRTLRFDPATDTFDGDEQANRMISRALREPWHF